MKRLKEMVGFTLIEVMVVVSIMVILGAIILPNVLRWFGIEVGV